jgi:ABC-type Co2+ transport system permease subunit
MLIPTFTLLLVHRLGGGISTGARDVLAMLVVTFVGFINLTNICRPYTKWRTFVAVGIGAMLVLGVGGVAVLDHLALGGSEFGLGYALENPVMLAVIMAVGALSAYLMHIIRKPLGGIVGKIGKKFSKK